MSACSFYIVFGKKNKPGLSGAAMKTSLAGKTKAQSTPHKKSLPKKALEREGFEPSKAEPSDLQSDPFGRSGTSPSLTYVFLHESEKTCNRFLKKISSATRFFLLFQLL